MTLHVRNTLTHRLERFEPLEDRVVKMYVCGPTVYDCAHIGHAMSAIVFDVIRRYLEYSGYRVIHVMNFTDVDDKIIERANELGQDPLDLVQRYIEAWFEHVLALNLLPAHHYPRVSQIMPQVIEIVRALIDKGYAYAVDGDVYFRVRAFDDYGKLSGRSLEEARAGEDRDLDAAPFIEALIDVRAALRQEKQWALADTIRDRLSDLGVALEDGPEGTEQR